MNLPNPLQKIFRPHPPSKEYFLGLTLFDSECAGSAWTLRSDGTLDIVKTEADAVANGWKERVTACDKILSAILEDLHSDSIHQVVFGLPGSMLTDTGDIDSAVKPYLKEITTMLDLKPAGFVDIDTAIVFSMKKNEGVPPSVILMHVQDQSLVISLFRGGTLIGKEAIAINGGLVDAVNAAMTTIAQSDVLPSRMLLFGAEKTVLENIQSQLLTYPWTTKANFLHYPKIEILSLNDVSKAVATAGASELALSMGIDIEIEQPKQEEQKKEKKENIVEAIDKAFEQEESSVTPEHANVVNVSPEELGFSPQQKKTKHILAAFSRIRQLRFPSFPKKPVSLPLIGIGIAGIVTALLLYLFVPSAIITLSVIPHTGTYKKEISIAPTVTEVSAEKFVLPGKEIEQSVTGEKTIAVTGKKKIGDPAKGAVTVYNKETSVLPLKKGTVLMTGNLEFSLDSDIQVASASESVDSKVYGKGTASLTASAIGTESNIPTGKQFTVKGMSSESVVAINDQPFTGGTSREAVVVTRADYDTLVKTLTDELVTKATESLSGSISGNEKMIEKTIKTTVTNKSFTEELDQEANNLHGAVTLTIKGIAYSEDDVKQLLLPLATPDIPSGYIVNEARTTVQLVNSVVKKDGSVTATAEASVTSIPEIDVLTIQKKLAGKNIRVAETILRETQGIGGAEIYFKHSFGKKLLPLRSSNIHIDVVVSK